MREWFEQQWDARVTAWAEPVGEADTLYEVIVEGQVLRADSLPLLIAALAERERPRLRLVA